MTSANKTANAHFGQHLLSTKLSMPQLPPGRIRRERLKLNRDAGGLAALTIICAPAGFGKTTALLSGLLELKLPIAWLALDSADNDAVRFLEYMIAALRSVNPDIGDFAARLLSSPNPPKPISLMAGLLNELSNQSQPIVLALDDYHLLESDEVNELVVFLIEQQPACLHIALTTRSQPKFPLSRLRVHGQVTEFSEIDLRLNHEEALCFFRDSAGLVLSVNEVVMLEARTEGWVAGLQLAALSLQGEEDTQAFIQAFAGDDRFITDYLTEEVLRLQSEDMRHFLLQTSILERLSGSLCNAVTGRSDSAELLLQLEQSDMFIIPLDNRRNWYRYHHLFAELLQNQLRQGSEDVSDLHRRAACWFSQEGAVSEALAHAFEIEDYPLATSILGRHSHGLFEQGQCAMLAQWYERIPYDVIEHNPCQLMLVAWVKYISRCEFDQDLIDRIDHSIKQEMVSEVERVQVNIDLELMKGFIALQARDYERAAMFGESVLAGMEGFKISDMAAPKLHLSVVYYSLGQLDKAVEFARASSQDCLENNTLLCLNGAVCSEMRVLIKRGRLSVAVELINSHIKLLETRGWLATMEDTTSWLYLCLGEIAYQRNQLDEAEIYYSQAFELAHNYKWEAMPASITIHMIRIYLAKNNGQAVKDGEQKLEHYKITPAMLPLLSSPLSEWAELDLRQGRLQRAEQRLSELNILLGQPLRAGFDDEYGLLVQLLLQRSKSAEAIVLLNELQVQEEDQPGQLLQWWLFQALAWQAQGNIRQALDYLQQAVIFAEQENYVRIFIDEGKVMAQLLAKLQKQQPSNYTQMLLGQFGGGTPKSKFIEQLLSKKEQKTLQLLQLGLSNSEIAERSFVSVNTVKTHLKNIYSKLAVDNRIQAVEKARELA